jgi:8-oxo-dGTP pyrophosphatase MutT (NUDIX family)
MSSEAPRSVDLLDITANGLSSKQLRSFAAGGVLPIRHRADTGCEVLIPLECRGGHLCCHILGGKKDVGESPARTASREFAEEVNKACDSKFQNVVREALTCGRDEITLHLNGGTDINNATSRVLWYAQGKFVLFITAVTQGI